MLSSKVVGSGLPEPKRCRISIDDNLDSSEHNYPMVSPQSQSTMMHLTGKFSVAMDLWTDIPSLNVELITKSAVSDVIWDGVTDEEMNRFWDTLPKKYGGLM